MKKIITSILPVLGLFFFHANFGFAQNEKKINADCEISNSSAPVNANTPKGSTPVQPFVNQLLFDNGSLVNFPGQGANGADVSAIGTGLHVYGFSDAFSANTRVADDFTVPAGQKWNIDSIVVYGYQTGSTNGSTFNGLHMAVRNANPLTNASATAIVWGDTTTDVQNNSYWSGIYRATSTTLTVTNRPIMANNGTTAGLSLLAGTYWLDWQSSGTLASGPWAPPVSSATTTITGDAIQFNAGTWVALIDTAGAGTTDDAPQGIPFKIYGSISNGVNEIYNNNNVSLYPNPMTSFATVSVADGIKKSSSGFSFAIYNVIGSMIRSTEGINTNTFTVKKDEIPAGVYIYEVKNGNEIIKRGKLSIQ